MKRIAALCVAIILTTALVLSLSTGVFAARSVKESVSDAVRYYNNNTYGAGGLFFNTAAAQLYRPLPEQFITETMKTPYTYELANNDYLLYNCSNIIFNAAVSNIKISELAPDWDPISTLVSAQREDGSFHDETMLNAQCLMALLAVNAEFNRDKAVDYILSQMIIDDEKGICGVLSEDGENIDYYTTFYLLLALSSFRARSDVGKAYLMAKDGFLALVDESGQFTGKGGYANSYCISSLALACAVDYGVDDVTSAEWKNVLPHIIDFQTDYGSYGEGFRVDDYGTSNLCFFGVTAVYMGQSGIGKLTEGRGFIDPDFSGDLLTAALITLAGVGIIAVVVLVIHAMNKGKKARMKDSEKSDEKAVS